MTTTRILPLMWKKTEEGEEEEAEEEMEEEEEVEEKWDFEKGQYHP